MRKHLFWQMICILGLLFGGTVIGFAGQPSYNTLEVGSGMFTMSEPTGATDDDLRVFYHRPSSWTPDRPVVIVLHGVNRDADRYRNEWQVQAEKYNLLIICPEFSEKKYPGDRYYNIGNVMDRGDEGGKVQPTSNRVYPVIDRVFDEVRTRSGSTRTTYSLYGHSAGAQFAHRFLLFAQSTKSDMIILANAGWYTMPDRNIVFPYGIKDIPMTDKELAKIFAQPAFILLGDQDINPNHKNLRHTPQADRQGVTRFERGHSFFEMTKVKAAELGVPFNWKLVIVPGVGHSDAGMSTMAAKLIAGEQ
ncbi:hypothetical protein AXX12_12560 [Anaerosporomusa subterranea]|uniref:Alpha/beta hydrolase n=1 Tax=Anaerosporomusa subterranea TaxID=1794912 RepID=A0A154BNR9_ANASB|nr:hypothetical protein [Anaerosporomusa subterranea]KYZ75539.1 hypothetical protein AXX12_12560 [Anaerosporomusa subterranea]